MTGSDGISGELARLLVDELPDGVVVLTALRDGPSSTSTSRRVDSSATGWTTSPGCGSRSSRRLAALTIQGFVKKPFRPATLVEAIERAIAGTVAAGS